MRVAARQLGAPSRAASPLRAGADRPRDARPTSAPTAIAAAIRAPRRATEDPPLVRWSLIAVALVFLAAFVLVPAASVVVEALRDGVALWWKALADPEALAAIRLTLLVAAISVPLNAVFGLAAA